MEPHLSDFETSFPSHISVPEKNHSQLLLHLYLSIVCRFFHMAERLWIYLQTILDLLELVKCSSCNDFWVRNDIEHLKKNPHNCKKNKIKKINSWNIYSKCERQIIKFILKSFTFWKNTTWKFIAYSNGNSQLTVFQTSGFLCLKVQWDAALCWEVN